jgi:hypothetical protein
LSWRSLPATAHGAGVIWKASVCFPDDLDIVVAKANRFSFVGWSFKLSVHRLANLIETPP